MSVYVVGQIKITDYEKWIEYKDQVQATLEPYGGKVLFRGSHIDAFVGEIQYPEIVAIEFKSDKMAKAWHNSKSYQSLVSIREKGAEIILHLYK
ncbi:conserved hypothetical protein [Sulfurovum sp. enrichment culture clone C5]|uniref:DUF1330 domain-containing protein n=1 Tax=Sulfurovum sp. enrichment culture clone C5 TaxID=497650 RepID=A0A0S4XLX7_9BACT|nr:conserved hypothetical protein [Sulfurovum sp. enrichment culture clone C5]